MNRARWHHLRREGVKLTCLECSWRQAVRAFPARPGRSGARMGADSIRAQRQPPRLGTGPAGARAQRATPPRHVPRSLGGRRGFLDRPTLDGADDPGRPIPRGVDCVPDSGSPPQVGARPRCPGGKPNAPIRPAQSGSLNGSSSGQSRSNRGPMRWNSLVAIVGGRERGVTVWSRRRRGSCRLSTRT